MNTNEYMNDYMKARYYERREIAIDRLGGKCVWCESTENLEFDHIDPEHKEFEFGKIWNYKWEFFLSELARAQLLCHNCHLDKTRIESPKIVDHGGGVSGKRNCPCDLCRAKKREYMVRYKA